MAKEVRIKANFVESENLKPKFHEDKSLQSTFAESQNVKAEFNDDEVLQADFADEEQLKAGFGTFYAMHTDNYDDLYNKPSINEVTLKGNKTFEELGDHILTNLEIKETFDRVFGG